MIRCKEAAMNQIEHAQQIFSMLLAAKYVAEKRFPNPDEIPRWAETALIYSKAFAETAEKKK